MWKINNEKFRFMEMRRQPVQWRIQQQPAELAAQKHVSGISS